MSNTLVCGCVEECTPILRDVLSIFENTNSQGSPYLNLEAFDRVAERIGKLQLLLILSLLDRMGYVEHSGNLGSSSWLTQEGEWLRESPELSEPS